jgi:hypothetical protein
LPPFTVHGYRLAVIREAERRGLTLLSEPLSAVIQLSAGCVVVDPVDIRLTFRAAPGLKLAERALRWCPADGWSVARHRLDPPARYFAGPGANPLQLVPTPDEVVDWACAQPVGSDEPPRGMGLDDDVAAIHRLLGFVDQLHPMSLDQAYLPGPIGPSRHDHHQQSEPTPSS